MCATPKNTRTDEKSVGVLRRVWGAAYSGHPAILSIQRQAKMSIVTANVRFASSSRFDNVVSVAVDVG